jgi:hypothetical protein
MGFGIQFVGRYHGGDSVKICLQMCGNNLHERSYFNRDHEWSEARKTAKILLFVNLLLIARPSPW